MSWQRLSRVLRLPKARRMALIQAAITLPGVHGLQQTLPFDRWRKLLQATRVRPCPPAARASAADIIWAVETARRTLPGNYRCLPAAYTAHLLLHLHGHDSQVRLGVARSAQGAIEAHAWVEHQGKVVVGQLDDLSRFAPLPGFAAESELRGTTEKSRTRTGTGTRTT